MTETIELSITVKDEARTLTKKEVIDDGFLICRQDPWLIKKIREVVDEFGGDLKEDAPSIVVRTKMILQ